MIYIVCPEKYATGGTELCHQLFYKIREKTPHVRIFYHNFSNSGDPIPPSFKKYSPEYVTEIEDSKENIIVSPETTTEILSQYKYIKKSVWWLSVFGYFLKQEQRYPKIIQKFARRILPLLKPRVLEDKTIIHFSQSHYASSFLAKHDTESHPLSDYLNESFFDEANKLDSSSREDVVLYNPKKGIAFTRKIILSMPEIQFIPLQNMTPQEVANTCKKAKVYIDFGNHPGKDRFPREAAILGCIIITGRQGAANNPFDVCIPEDLKFSDSTTKIPEICSKIRSSIKHFAAETVRLDPYRDQIRQQEKIFNEEVDAVWNLIFSKFST